MCDHLLQATTYPKTKIFPVKILWSQPLVNDGLSQATATNFWADGLIVFALFLTSCNRLPELSTGAPSGSGEPRSGTFTLPLTLRSEHDLNKFGFGLKRHFRSKPKWASSTFAILSCSNFFLSVIGFCVVFSFHQGPIQTSLAELGTPDWILFKIRINKLRHLKTKIHLWALK